MVVIENNLTSKVDGLFVCFEESDATGVLLEGFQDSIQT